MRKSRLGQSLLRSVSFEGLEGVLSRAVSRVKSVAMAPCWDSKSLHLPNGHGA